MVEKFISDISMFTTALNMLVRTAFNVGNSASHLYKVVLVNVSGVVVDTFFKVTGVVLPTLLKSILYWGISSSAIFVISLF